jgi:hypothetical protein
MICLQIRFLGRYFVA